MSVSVFLFMAVVRSGWQCIHRLPLELIDMLSSTGFHPGALESYFSAELKVQHDTQHHNTLSLFPQNMTIGQMTLHQSSPAVYDSVAITQRLSSTQHRARHVIVVQWPPSGSVLPKIDRAGDCVDDHQTP